MSLSYHKRLRFHRTYLDLPRDLWQAVKASARRFFIEDFADWMDRR